MEKNWKAHIATAAVILAAFGIGWARKTGWRPPDIGALRVVRQQAGSEPQDTVYTMLAAARTGDVKAYLDSYTGQMAVTLRQHAADLSESGFARYLRDSNAAVKGVAVSEVKTTADNETEARVEYVYQDRNEVQWLYLEKTRAGWKISRLDNQERVKTLVPYGTPVR